MVIEECSKLVLQIDDMDRELGCRGVFMAPNDVAHLLRKRANLLELTAKHMGVAEVPLLKQGNQK